LQRLLGAVIAGGLALGALAGCSHPRSSRPDTPTTTPSVTPPGSPSAYVDTPTPTVTTTPTTQAGNELRLKQPATVQWSPRPGTTALIDLAVDDVQRTSFTDKAWQGWDIPAKTQQSTPYFVHATVRSISGGSLDGLPVPLYAFDDANQLLLASTFKSAFTPCTPSTLPAHFRAGQTAKVCLVYLVPKGAHYVSMAYRPDESQQPITWTGR
jgi:hypothetical protein